MGNLGGAAQCPHTGSSNAMLYHAQQQWLFTHVSRTGGTSISDALRQACLDTRSLLAQHTNLVDARTLLGEKFEPCFRFAFVRNPWERFVSWYAMIGATLARTRGDDGYRNEPNHAHWLGFPAFLRRWSAERMTVDGRDQPRHSQWAQLSDANDQLLTHTIGRFEDFANERKRIFAELGIAVAQSQHLALNRSGHLHYSAYYSMEMRALVETVYRDDIERFGYTYEQV